VSERLDCDAYPGSKAIVNAMNGLPVLARLEFVKNIIFDRGGSRDSAPQDEALIVANDVLRDIIELVKKSPAKDLRL
jgi:hypothetical protein